MSDSQTLLQVIAGGANDPIEIAKALPDWGAVTIGSALFKLMQNGWIGVDKEGNFYPNT